MIYKLILQIDTSAIGQSGEETLPLFELLLKGGWLMIPIFILAIAAVYIFIERYLTIKKAGEMEQNFMNKIRDMVVNGNIEGAIDLCRQHNTPSSRMIMKGLTRIGNPLKDIAASIENAANLEVFKLEKNLATLATISGAAPMIGFLGTVTGMIRAFYNLANAGNNIDPGMLAGGIYEALITTATGLAVGIIAYIGYNLLTAMIEKVVFRMEGVTVEFIDILHEPA
ncbi:MAG: MotA/TolQ/ExbB proton channel family protein [Bacteroidia bacterium]